VNKKDIAMITCSTTAMPDIRIKNADIA